MASSKQRRPPQPAHDPTLCHYCHKNKLDPKECIVASNPVNPPQPGASIVAMPEPSSMSLVVLALAALVLLRRAKK
jgi:hypothetical protein